jgi:hypothetical protein
MFGYITINKPEIRFKDFYRFRSYYCGLCCQLKREYGNSGRAALGYDMTFLVVLLSGLYDTETSAERFRCIAHPFSKRVRRINEFTQYAADMNLLLTYHKCMDDWHDEKRFTRRIYAAVISSKVRRVEKKWHDKSQIIKENLDRQSVLEKENCSDMDAVSGCFGNIMSEIFAYKDDVWTEYLREMGFFLGKYIYLLDAYDDVFDDREKQCYNPFISICDEKDFDDRAEKILKMMISESADAFEMLPVDENMEILRNIIYSGVWRSFEIIRIKREKGRNI